MKQKYIHFHLVLAFHNEQAFENDDFKFRIIKLN